MGTLAQQEAQIEALKLRLQSLRVPNINFAPSSSNPHEVVTASATGISLTISNMISESQGLVRAISAISAVRSRVLALIHSFATKVYYEKVFSGLSESIFERYKVAVDARIAERCGDVLERLPSIYDRLVEGDTEAISQALNSCRRVIDSFADAIYPPTEGTLEVDGQTIQLSSSHH